MIKDTQNIFSFVQDNEQFLNEVFQLSQITHLVIVKNSKKFINAENAIVFRSDINIKFCRYHAIVNDFEVRDFYGYVDKGLRRHEKLRLSTLNYPYTESLRYGMLSMLPTEQAKEYFDALRQFEQTKLDNYLSKLEKWMPQQE